MADYTRVRTRGSYTAFPVLEQYEIWTTCAQPSWTLTSNPSSAMTPGSKETMYDVEIPNFYARRRRGEIFFNPMQKSLRSNLISNPGNGQQQEKISTITCSGIPRKYSFRQEGAYFARYCYTAAGSDGLLPVDRLISSSDLNALQTEVSTRCLAQRGRTNSNLFESLAEYRQTLNLLRRPFSSLNRILSRASSSRERGMGAAEAWLQYRYGVLPTVRDIGSIIDGVKKQTGRIRQSVRAQGSLSRSASPTLNVIGGFGNNGVIEKQTLDNIEVKAVALDEYVVSMANNLGFSMKGLVTLPWELIPYSFVADWFLNVGDFLNAMVPLPGVKSLGSCLVIHRVNSVSWRLLSLSPNTGNTMVRMMTGNCLSSIDEKTRVPLVQPEIVIKSDFRLTDAVRLADAASLIVQRLGRAFT